MLLDRGTAIDATSDQKWTALHCAADRGHVEAVNMLLDRGAAIDATSDKKWTALHCAASSYSSFMHRRAHNIESAREGAVG